VTRRILIYGINYAPEIAGVGKFTGEIGGHLADLDHDITVITSPPHYPGWRVRGGYDAGGWRGEVVAGQRVVRCPIYMPKVPQGVGRVLAPLSFALSSAPAALIQVLRSRPEVILCVEPTLLVAPTALVLARMVGARCVLHVQDLEVDAAIAVGHLKRDSLAARFALSVERFLLRGFDQVITISEKMAEHLVLKGVRREKVAIVRNWVDLTVIRPTARNSKAYRKQLGIPADAFVVLYSGNIGEKQDFDTVIEAASALRSRPDILLVIAGEGPKRSAVEKAAAELGNIRVIDFQPEAAMGEFLGVANLHLIPQDGKTADLLLPSKLGGALASGRQIVVTAEPGTELANFLGSSCLLVPPGDPQALASTIAAASEHGAADPGLTDRLALADTLSKTESLRRFADHLCG
jgi:colanic acid biosynthesis glycosyl transferase WcaI